MKRAICSSNTLIRKRWGLTAQTQTLRRSRGRLCLTQSAAARNGAADAEDFVRRSWRAGFVPIDSRSAVGATRRPYLLRFVCDLYRGSKSTRPLWESSTNRYRTDGILSPVSRAISLYLAPFLYMLTIMFILSLQSMLHEDDFSWLRRRPAHLGN